MAMIGLLYKSNHGLLVFYARIPCKKSNKNSKAREEVEIFTKM